MVCWGSGSYGQLGRGQAAGGVGVLPVVGLTNASSVAAGNNHTCAVDTGGHTLCWGLNDSGQLGDGTKTSHDKPQAVSWP